MLAGGVVGGLPWLLGNLRHDRYSSTRANEGTWTEHLHNLVVSTLPEALGLRLAVVVRVARRRDGRHLLYVVCAAGFVSLLVRRPPRLGLPLAIVAVLPVFYFVSPVHVAPIGAALPDPRDARCSPCSSRHC